MMNASLVFALKEQCNLEPENKSAKINLSHKPNFNIYDAFRIFGVPRYGSINFY